MSVPLIQSIPFRHPPYQSYSTRRTVSHDRSSALFDIPDLQAPITPESEPARLGPDYHDSSPFSPDLRPASDGLGSSEPYTPWTGPRELLGVIEDVQGEETEMYVYPRVGGFGRPAGGEWERMEMVHEEAKEDRGKIRRHVWWVLTLAANTSDMDSPVCDKTFNRPSSLSTHMAVHTGAKRECWLY
jgi:hypothetical protein